MLCVASCTAHKVLHTSQAEDMFQYPLLLVLPCVAEYHANWLTEAV